jgi:hypothetical protein
VKNLAAIRQTLDARGKNRGLLFDVAMAKYAGRVFTVDARVEKIISAKSGAMIRMQTDTPLIKLTGLHCTGFEHNLCHRMDVFFWREAWLERYEQPPACAPNPRFTAPATSPATLPKPRRTLF